MELHLSRDVQRLEVSKAFQTYNLRKVERVIANGVEYQILQLVDDAQEIFTKTRHVATYLKRC